MASCNSAIISRYKRLIDEGYGMTFSDAMMHESKAANEWAKTITANNIAEQREGIQARGRTQNG